MSANAVLEPIRSGHEGSGLGARSRRVARSALAVFVAVAMILEGEPEKVPRKRDLQQLGWGIVLSEIAAAMRFGSGGVNINVSFLWYRRNRLQIVDLTRGYWSQQPLPCPTPVA